VIAFERSLQSTHNFLECWSIVVRGAQKREIRAIGRCDDDEGFMQTRYLATRSTVTAGLRY
jgi:hypothetical protein